MAGKRSYHGLALVLYHGLALALYHVLALLLYHGRALHHFLGHKGRGEHEHYDVLGDYLCQGLLQVSDQLH